MARARLFFTCPHTCHDANIYSITLQHIVYPQFSKNFAKLPKMPSFYLTKKVGGGLQLVIFYSNYTYRHFSARLWRKRQSMWITAQSYPH